MSDTRFNSAAVIGTGMMGPGIALTLAMAGLRTTVLSRTTEGAARGVEKARAQVDFLAANQLVDADQAARAADLIEGSTAFDEVIGGAGLVIESGPEDMAFKQELFARMDALTPRAILASNTSGMSITAVASRCRHRERVLTTHFWNPPHLMPLVEVVMGEQTSAENATAVRDLLLAGGKAPVVVRKDRPGHLANRLQMALLREAVHIVAEGIADAHDVDTAAKNGFGLRLPAYGILEHMDMVGLDLSISVLEYVAKDLYAEPRAPELFRACVRNGDLGVKTGKGFYDWSVKSAAEVKAGRDAFLVEVLRYRRG